MADDVRSTQHPLEVGYSTLGEDCRVTGENLEAVYDVEPLTGRITSIYLEAAYVLGPPPPDVVRDTSHHLEVAYSVEFETVGVDCPFATSYIPGVRRQQSVCQ